MISCPQATSAKELEEEEKTQNTLLADLMEYTGILKDSTVEINRSVVEQNEVSRAHSFREITTNHVFFPQSSNSRP